MTLVAFLAQAIACDRYRTEVLSLENLNLIRVVFCASKLIQWLCMVAERGSTGANHQPAAAGISHEGMSCVVINQDNVNQLMERAQRIKAAAPGASDGNALEAARPVMGMVAR